MNERRPRLAYPFTILTDSDVVRLVAGEDVRYTLSAPHLDRWLPELLARLDGKTTMSELLANVPQPFRSEAHELVVGLYGERVLVDAPARLAHEPIAEASEIRVFRQDRLDYGEVLSAHREARQAGHPFLWVSIAAVQRAYVGPLILPDCGPCFRCLFRTFERLSPAPELYEALLDHGRKGGSFEPAEFPATASKIVEAILEWKLSLASEAQPPAALYRLHVVERDTLAVLVERVFRDPECPDCRRPGVAEPHTN